MEVKHFNIEDKATWGDGPWVMEPDHVETWDEATGYPVLINRNRVGALCGYVGIPEGHPLHGKTDRQWTEESSYAYMKASHELLMKYGGFGEIPEHEYEEIAKLHVPNPNYDESVNDFECHGGITYFGPGTQLTKEMWFKWRESMLDRKTEAEEYPHGDMAQEWKEEGHLLDDPDGWIEYHKARCIVHAEAPNYWWAGFDCAHGCDLSPKMEADMDRLIPDRTQRPKGGTWEQTYRDIEYVRNECRELAQQLFKVASEQLWHSLGTQKDLPKSEW